MPVVYKNRSMRPVAWWEVAALQNPAAQVFGDYFVECLGESVVTCRVLSLELKMHESYDVVEDWQILSVRDVWEAERAWGEGGADIAAWFDEGDLYSKGFRVNEPTSTLEPSLLWSFVKRIPVTVGSFLGLV